jgi:alkylation response protein AidB-like acyl-CoA dehydrogenase
MACKPGQFDALESVQDDLLRVARDCEHRAGPSRELRDMLGRAGLFRPFVQFARPAAGEVTAALRAIAALATIDGSIGWLIAQSSLAQIVVGSLSEAMLAKLEIDQLKSGPVIAGSFAPKGRASRRGDGWLINGRWPLVTGCEWADWIYVNAFAMNGRRISLDANGDPVTRIFILPAGAARIVGNWDVLGLRGTGSHDVAIEDCTCREEESYILQPCQSQRSSFTPASYAGLFGAAVAVGIARGAIDDVREVVLGGKRPTFGKSGLADDPHVHERLGAAWMAVTAASALLERQAARVDCQDLRSVTDIQRSELQATSRQVKLLCDDATTIAFHLARSNSIRYGVPLERRLRDQAVIGQHVWNGWESFERLGRDLLRPQTGREVRDG